MVSASREIRFEQAFNVRDLGGLTTTDGRTVRGGRVYRSDDPFLLTAGDLDVLRALGIGSVLDLRMAGEVGERGSAAWDALDVEHHLCPLVEDLPAMEDHAKYVDPAWTAALYLDMLEHGRPGHQRLWQALAGASAGRTFIHCASGRDRTGIVVALLLGFLGVDDEQVVGDYTLSAAGMTRMLAWLDEHRPDLAAIVVGDRAAMVLTPPETMRLFLDGLRRRHGGFEQYAAGLGVTDEVAVLRRNLLED